MQSALKFGEKLRKAIAEATTPPLPRRIKRLIMTASIAGMLQETDTPDKILISKLNKALRLDYQSAWLLPMRASSLIWKNSGSESIALWKERVQICNLGHCQLDQAEESAAVSWFLSHMPKWLRYGSDQLMTHDIQQVFRQLRVTV